MNGIYSGFGNFWDIETSGIAASAIGIGETTAQMKMLSTFISAYWDFSTADGDPADWCMPIDNYPQLRWQIVDAAEVPNIIGLSQPDAESAIIAAGLVVGATATMHHNAIPAGDIAEQSIPAGTCVAPGMVIGVAISLGKPIVPDLVGLSQIEAQAALNAVTLAVGTITNQYHDSVPAGHVVSQSPVSGTPVDVGSKVTLVISLGMPVVPNVTGMTQANAQAAITSAGLTVGVVTTRYHDTVLAGRVISQSPPAGTVAGVGSAVNLEVSLGKPVVPNTTTL